ncbi:MAG TPA: LysR family transcriptional regulator [Myxococcota bacterium]|nr:LysR family transcriptional regulator [Myxococcota bacterium]
MLPVAQMVLFAKVVEAGSFAAAAKQLGQTRAAVAKQIAVLEERVGAQLLQRTTRSMQLTEIGAELYARCARIAEEAAEAERAIASLQGAPRGLLRVVAPVTFGMRHLAPLVAPFLAEQPEIRLDLVLSDAAPDWSADRVDVAVRIAANADAGYVAHALAPSPLVVVASPEYFRRRGVPKQPEDLRAHACLLYSSLPTPSLWRFRRGRSIRVQGRLSVNHGETLRAAVLGGAGIAYMPRFIVGEDLAAGRLASALDEFAQSSQRIFLVYPRGRNLAPKLRAFVDFVLARFQPVPPWEADAPAAQDHG